MQMLKRVLVLSMFLASVSSFAAFDGVIRHALSGMGGSEGPNATYLNAELRRRFIAQDCQDWRNFPSGSGYPGYVSHEADHSGSNPGTH